MSSDDTSTSSRVEVDERSCFGRPHHAQPDRCVRMLNREINGLTRHSKGTNPHLQMSAWSVSPPLKPPLRCDAIGRHCSPSSVDQRPAHGLRNPAAAVDACIVRWYWSTASVTICDDLMDLNQGHSNTCNSLLYRSRLFDFDLNMCVSHLGFDSRTPAVPETDLAMGMLRIRDRVQSDTQPRRRNTTAPTKILRKL